MGSLCVELRVLHRTGARSRTVFYLVLAIAYVERIELDVTVDLGVEVEQRVAVSGLSCPALPVVSVRDHDFLAASSLHNVSLAVVYRRQLACVYLVSVLYIELYGASAVHGEICLSVYLRRSPLGVYHHVVHRHGGVEVERYCALLVLVPALEGVSVRQVRRLLRNVIRISRERCLVQDIHVLVRLVVVVVGQLVAVPAVADVQVSIVLYAGTSRCIVPSDTVCTVAVYRKAVVLVGEIECTAIYRSTVCRIIVAIRSIQVLLVVTYCVISSRVITVQIDLS